MQIDAAGLVLDTVLEILVTLQTRVRDALESEIETGPETALGQVLAILANFYRVNQEAIAAAYLAAYRASATGVNLDRVGSLTGTPRLPATASRVTVDVTITGPVTIAPGGLVVAVSGAPERAFANEAEIDEAGAGTYSHPFAATVTGPVEAPAGTLTAIPVPVAGVSAVTNPLDADLGTDIETDTAYRARQETELARAASATVDGMRVDILDQVVDADGDRQIQDCRVFENPTDVTNPDGLPPHSVEVVIWDGSPPAAADLDVAQAVWDSHPAGIETYGTVTVAVVDSRGDSRTAKFTRATQVDLNLEITLEVGSEYTAATETRIKAGLVAFWAAQSRIGQDLIRSQLYDPIWDAVERDKEVRDIQTLLASKDLDPPAASNVAIDVREIGDLQTANISISTV